MNSINKNQKIVSKDDKRLRKPQKHDVNLQKNSTIYFQVGLIVSLLATYFFMDMQFLSTDYKINFKDSDNDVAEVYDLDNIKIYKDPVKKVEPEVEPPKRKKVVITNVIVPVDNDFKLTESTEVITQEQNTTNKPSVQVNTTPTKVENKEMNINFVEQVPIFPGCEGLSTNLERKQCMNEKINRLVSRKFNTGVGDGLGLKGQQRFHVQFKINQNGDVVDIRTNSKYSQLDKEAKRVIGKIPKMQPGKQHNKNVAVIYNLPINFQMIN